MSNKTLGRGLSSLIHQNKTSPAPPASQTTPYFPKINQGISDTIIKVPINKIKTNPHQPRQNFSEIHLNELINSIKKYGVIQPLIVTQTLDGNYELIAGERRLRASYQAGLKEIPVIVRTAKEIEKLEISLIENIQRQDLNPIEKAQSYKKLIDEFNLTHEQAAARLGISRAHFSNLIRLLSLSEDIQKGLIHNKITLGQAKVLLEIKDSSKQEQIYKKAVQTGMNIVDTQKEIRKIKIKPHTRQIKKDPQIKTWENQLQATLNTRVSIRQRGQIGGVIEIEFYSEEELQNLTEKISK